MRLILLLLLLCKLFQFCGELFDSLIHRELSVDGRNKKVADRRESWATNTEDREGRLKIDVLGGLSTVFVVRHHLLVRFALLNREIRRDMPASRPSHVFDHIGNELQ